MEWNQPGEESVEFDIARLNQLRASPIGGLLLLVSHWDVDSASFGEPVIQVLANPAMATLGSFSSSARPGINLSEAWDMTSAPFDQMPVTDTTCPLLAMSGGFSRMVHPLTLANYLLSTAPLFIPIGEEVAGTVSIVSGSPILRAFYLPTVASLPVGMFWEPKDLTPESMMKSIKAMSFSSPSPYASFIHVLESLDTKLSEWLEATSKHPQRFACPAYGFDTIQSQFPILVPVPFRRPFSARHILQP